MFGIITIASTGLLRLRLLLWLLGLELVIDFMHAQQQPFQCRVVVVAGRVRVSSRSSASGRGRLGRLGSSDPEGGGGGDSMMDVRGMHSCASECVEHEQMRTY